MYISRNTIARTFYIAFAASLSTRSVERWDPELNQPPEVAVEGLPAVFQPTFTGMPFSELNPIVRLSH